MRSFTTETERAQGAVLTWKLFDELYGDCDRLTPSIYWADTFREVGTFMGFDVEIQGGTATWEVGEHATVGYRFPRGGMLRIAGDAMPTIHCWCLLTSKLVLPQKLKKYEVVDMTTGNLKDDMHRFGVRPEWTKKLPEYIWMHEDQFMDYCLYRGATYNYHASYAVRNALDSVMAAMHRIDRITYREASHILATECDRWLSDSELPPLDYRGAQV